MIRNWGQKRLRNLHIASVPWRFKVRVGVLEILESPEVKLLNPVAFPTLNLILETSLGRTARTLILGSGVITF